MSQALRLLVPSLDMDGVAEYARLHDLPPPREGSAAMYEAPLARFAGLCRTAGGGGTVFAIGRDVAYGAGPRLAEVSRAGLEVASHSFAHDYALCQRTREEIADDLDRADAALTAAVGARPQGFRAPGYNTSPVLLAEVARRYNYDSSALPSPSYYALKATVLAGYALTGRRSSSVLGSITATFGAREPTRAPSGLWELPVAAAGPLRVPVTAAALIVLPALARRHVLRALRGTGVVVVNVHALDLCDAARDGIPAELVARQPELRRPLTERLRLLSEALAELAVGREVVSCSEAVKRLTETR